MTYTDLLSKLSNPTKSALLYDGIDSFEKLASFTEKEILSLHGIGPKSLPTLNEGLASVGLSFKKSK